MNKKYMLLFALFFAYASPSLADVYFHVGGGIDYLSHDKSEKDYPALNLKGGVGYKISPNIGIELDVTGKSTSSYSGTGTCTTTLGGQVSCTKNDEITRLMAIGSGVYNKNLGFAIAFVKAGVGFVQSTYRSAYDSTEAPSLVLADEDYSGVVGVLNAGIVKSDRHRFGGIISTKYGDSSSGKFLFVGFEYNYIISL